MYKISVHTAVQIEMDRCTGQYAIQLRSAALAMDESYKRFKIARTAYLAACLAPGGEPPATKAAEAYLKIEYVIQSAIKIYWDAKMFSWADPLFLSCKVPRLILRSSFPEFPYQIISGTIQDFMKPVNSLPSRNTFFINLKHKNLISTAEVKRNESNRWNIRWTE